MLYATAIKYQAEELEEFCFRFSLNHMTAVAQTEAFAKLDELTLKDFIIKAAVHGAFKSWEVYLVHSAVRPIQNVVSTPS